MSEKKTFRKSNQLFFITGPMFAGKTTKLINKYRYLKKQGKFCLIFKPALDIRDKTNLVSCHNHSHNKAIFVKKSADAVEYLKRFKKKIDYVFFNEVNFFDEEIMINVKKIQDMGIAVVLSGLTYDFKNEIFPPVKKILKSNLKIKRCYAGCYLCFQKANSSKRINESKEVILIGGRDIYAATCQKCHQI